MDRSAECGHPERVAAAAGVVVGPLRGLTRLPEQVPGLFDDLKTEHVDPALVAGSRPCRRCR